MKNPTTIICNNKHTEYSYKHAKTFLRQYPHIKTTSLHVSFIYTDVHYFD